MRVAVLGPGGVGGLLAGALWRSGAEVVVVARGSTAELIGRDGISIQSVRFGDFTARPRAAAQLREPVDALLVATKAAGLESALERVEGASSSEREPAVVLPLLNGLDHLALLRERFPADSVLAGSIRVEADRPRAGAVVHTSPFLLVSMASHAPSAEPRMRALAAAFERAEVPAQVRLPISYASEAQVLWSKLVRLNALACTTSAYDVLLGEIRSTPALRADLEGAIEEACAIGRAEGAPDVDPAKAIAELEAAHATLGSSMQRDIAAGREPELDAIPGSVLRAGARHGIACPTIERLVALIEARIAARAA
ncbi:MAG TPA: 2-dehydropantoate 2-reductase [Solirubrobacteraceae bacterium]|jgi:2-dehydropantoate 2-reductase|nr:2-dehydropantoate 2-reductase [Solirubrobacteraceae bacterium]